MRLFSRIALILLALSAATAFVWRDVSGLARLHLALTRSDPAKDAVVRTAPDNVTLWFTEAPEIKVTDVELADASGKAQVVGRLRIAQSDARQVIAPLAQKPGPGSYIVAWRTMSRDGHVVKGSFSFRVAP